MMKTPTTKKLSKKMQYAAEGYQPIDSDELFYQVPKYTDIFISQYAQIIQVFKNGKAIVRKTFYVARTGYTTITLTNNWGKRKNWGIHDLVAQVWLEKPTFAEGEALQVHHIIKVKSNLKKQAMNINFGENLMYVYSKYHKIHDLTRSIKVATYNGNWKFVKSIEEVAKYYNLSLLEVYEILLAKPTFKDDTLEYYEIDDKKSIEIHKFRSKTKKKTKK